MWLFKPTVSKLKEKRDIPKLINMLNDADYKVRQEICEALIEIGDVDTIPILFDFHSHKAKSDNKHNVVSTILGIAKKFTSSQLSRLRYLNLLELRDAEKSADAALILLIDCFEDPKYEDFLVQMIQSTDYLKDRLNIYRKCGCSSKSLASLLTDNKKSISYRQEILETMVNLGDPDTSTVLQEVLKFPISDPDVGKRPIDSVSENMQRDHPEWYSSYDFIPHADNTPDFIAKIKKYASQSNG